MPSSSNINYVDLLPVAVIVINNNGIIVNINATTEDLLASSARQVIGRDFSECVGESSAVSEVVKQILNGHASLNRYECELYWNGILREQVNLYARAGGSDEQAVILTILPLGNRKKLDRSLSHNQASRSISSMAEMLAHEVRNPLAGIKGAAQLLSMNLSESENEFTDLIISETDRIGKLIDSFEVFTDQSLAKRDSLNIHTILNQAKRVAEAGFASHVTFHEIYDPSLPDIAGDRDQLMQVFLNLLKNAAEAVDQHSGIITLGTAYKSGMKIAVNGQKAETVPIEITITDNGSGINDEIINEIFNPFITTKNNGTGLGLALVSKIITAHGGMIEVQSQPGQTQFRLLLPMWAE